MVAPLEQDRLRALIVAYADRITPFREDPVVTRQIAMCKAQADRKGMSVTRTDVVYRMIDPGDPYILEQMLAHISDFQDEIVLAADWQTLFDGPLRQCIADQEILKLGIGIISVADCKMFQP